MEGVVERNKSYSWYRIKYAVGPIVFSLFFSYILVVKTDVGKAKIVDSEFLFVSIGVLLGFAFTLLTFIISMLDKIREYTVNKASKNSAEKARIIYRSNRLLREIKDNTIFIFSSLVVSVLCMVVEKIDVKDLQFEDYLGVSKLIFLNTIKLSIFILNIYSIYDLLKVTFKVSDSTEIVYK